MLFGKEATMLSQRPIVVIAGCILVTFHLCALLPSISSAWYATFGLVLIIPWCMMQGWCNPKQAILYIATLFIALAYYQIRVNQDYSVWEQRIDGVNIEQKLRGAWEGVISTPPERDGDRVQFQFIVTGWKKDDMQQWNKVCETLFVKIKLQQQREWKWIEQWKRGQMICIQGQLSLPDEASNFDSFSYRNYLQMLGIQRLLQVMGAEKLTLVNHLHTVSNWNRHVIWNKALSYVDEMRNRFTDKLQHLYKQPHSGYVQSLLLGVRNQLDPMTWQHFSQLGLTHVLAISGLHVGVFVSALCAIFRCLRITKETSVTIIMSLLPLYMLLTGAAPSVMRAGLMAVLALYGMKRGWLKDSLHLLAAVFILFVLWEPRYMVQVSFQLSFVVTVGLIYFVPKAMKLLYFLPQSLSAVIAVTVVAQAVSFPMTVYYFNQFSCLSLIANISIVPLISLCILPLSNISLLVGMLSESIARPLVIVVEQLNQFSFWLVRCLTNIEGGTLIWSTPSIWWMVVYYIILCLLFIIAERWLVTWRIKQRQHTQPGGDHTQPLDFIPLVLPQFRYSGTALLLTASLFVMVICGGYYGGYTAEATVSFIDVGQGDCTLITTATGRHMLIDGGGTINVHRATEQWRKRKTPFEIGEKVVVPLLKRRGIRELDMIVLTHADQDHAGGLAAVIKHIPVKQFVINGTWKATASIRTLFQTIIDKNIPIRKWEAGQFWELDPWSFIHVLYPLPSGKPTLVQRLDKQNKASLVVQLLLTNPNSKQPFSFLLTGDVEADGEKHILHQISHQVIRSSDVLKIAHHGSKTSTTTLWIQTWQPKIGVISVGRHNRYGHPHSQVMHTLSAARVPVLRTDVNGEVQFRVTATGLKVRTKHPVYK